MRFLLEWLRYPRLLKGWVLFLILFPFYFFGSGLPQVSDWLFALLLASAHSQLSLNTRSQATFRKILAPLSLLVGYAFAVTLAWIPINEAPGTRPYLMLLFPVFFLYNALVVRFSFCLYQKWGSAFITATAAGIALSVFLQIMLMPVSYGFGARSSLFFNNPNQLGYFALLALTCFLFLERYATPPAWIKIVFFGSATVLAVASASKAAMLSAVLLIVVNLLDSGLLRIGQLIAGACSIALLVVLANFTPLGQEFAERATNRLSEIGSDNDDSLEARGYDRMWKYPEYMLVGAGEGGFERFYRDPKRQYEMHSTFGTLLFSYGIIGFGAFTVFAFRTFKGAHPIAILYAMPLLAYGVTHMGLRFTLFWVFFALVAITSDMRRKQRTFATTNFAPSMPHD
ncbi:O-antigen ligase family protein [Roseimaritima sediminicola]|uniref:O-antigen ligase family protein n=1 Tax=Roseimaritima sediminicola TaxID=2662066 RepID=UPI0012985778|nr:hypothetical protein [Roseimaritima sediminicola]